MSLTEKNVKEFAEYLKDKGDDKQETVRFWIELLSLVWKIRQSSLNLKSLLSLRKTRNTLTVIFHLQRF